MVTTKYVSCLQTSNSFLQPKNKPTYNLNRDPENRKDTVDFERVMSDCFGQYIVVLKNGRCVDDEVVPFIDVLRAGACHEVLRNFHSTLSFLEDWYARHVYIRQHKTPNLPLQKDLSHSSCKRYVLCQCRGKRDGFLCPREPRHTSFSAHYRSSRT